MSKPKEQGTRLETLVVHRLQDQGLVAGRLAEGGNNDLGDVWAGTHPQPDDKFRIVALWWKRLVDTGKKRRQPDGEPEVVVLDPSTFLMLLRCYLAEHDYDVPVIIETKARQVLNVTRELHKARRKATP